MIHTPTSLTAAGPWLTSLPPSDMKQNLVIRVCLTRISEAVFDTTSQDSVLTRDCSTTPSCLSRRILSLMSLARELPVTNALEINELSLLRMASIVMAVRFSIRAIASSSVRRIPSPGSPPVLGSGSALGSSRVVNQNRPQPTRAMSRATKKPTTGEGLEPESEGGRSAGSEGRAESLSDRAGAWSAWRIPPLFPPPQQRSDLLITEAGEPRKWRAPHFGPHVMTVRWRSPERAM